MTHPDRLLAVGRIRKAHGLKGDCVIFPLTGTPERWFAADQELWLLDLNGAVIGGPIRVARGRGYHRQWLVAFSGYPDRTAVERLTGLFVAVPADRLAPPEEGEVYLHELVGFAVQDPDGNALGLVSACLDLPGGVTLEVQGPKREFLLPFKREFVVELDRQGRRISVDLPEGLMDL